MRLTADKELEFGCALPDYAPDILVLIKAECVPSVESAKASAGKCLIDGRADFKLIYATGYNGKIRSVSFSKQFSHTFDCPSGLVEPYCDAAAEASYVGCKISDPRNLMLRAHIRIDCLMRGSTQVRCIDTDATGGRFFKKKDVTTVRAEASSVSGEALGEILLGRGEPAASEIISHSIRLQPPRVSYQSDGIVMRSDASVTVIYEPENTEAEICSVTRSIPVVLEMNDIPERSEPDADMTVVSSSAVLMPDNYGENRLFKMRIAVSGKVTVCKAEEITLAEDMFTPKFKTECERGTAECIREETVTEKTFGLDIRLTPTEPFTEILHTNASFRGISAEKCDGGVRIYGMCCAEVLGKQQSGCDSAEQCETVDRVLTYDVGDGEICDVSVYLLDASPTLTADGTVTVRITAEAKIRCAVFENVSFLSAISKEEPIDTQNGGMTAAYYFPSASDDLWSIAKQYSKDPESIKQQNSGVFAENGTLVAGTPYVRITL